MGTIDKQYTTVLFDLGNVLFQIHFNKCFDAWSASSSMSTDEISSLFRFDDSYAKHERNEISGEEYYNHIKSLIKIDISFKDFLTGWNAIYGDVISETMRFIKENNKKFRIYGFSNTNALHREYWINRYSEELSYFEKIFCSDELGKRKPEFEAFDAVLKNIGVDKKQVIFTDDLEENVVNAQQFGITSVLFKNSARAIREIEELLVT